MNARRVDAEPWYRQAAKLIPKHIYLKSIGTTLFISLFFFAYFYVLKNPAYPITVMPTTLLDSLIDFQPLALPVYLSLWVYVSLPPIFLATRGELYRYGMAAALTCLAGLTVFYFWPTTAPVADIDWARYPEMLFLKNMDASGNAFPSLHVATAVFSGIWLHHLLRRLGGPWWILSINGLWCIGIVYSTLATRQHVAVDMWAGVALGGLTAGLSLRHHLKTTVAIKVSQPLI
ncbi:phosphatase PAP2 family protein [Polaromonas sp.]|jgi:membrane-associated phospholipid phosphatase|uniref:phosphatase PAP2 family protein n=1 Tax=Polaromonas sp. TaxID=1869339 RepID=UPI001D2BD3CF|nr:phosphatase PAP2 family protein [Polaromonas sp.]MBT9474949.1 phosphatase PAP2 family protein [Polaromonas sp.]